MDEATRERFDGLVGLRDITLWTAVAVTVFSGVEYSVRAARMLGRNRDCETPNDDTAGS